MAAGNEIDEILKYDPGRGSSGGQKSPPIGGVVDDVLKYDPQETSISSSSSKPEDDLTWRQALVSGFKKFPSSLLSNVVDTAKGAGTMAVGGMKLLLNPQKTAGELADLDYGNIADSLVELYKKRYGSVGGFQKTLATDPAGILSDISTAVTGAGGAVSAVGKVGKLSTMANVGSKIAKTGAAIDPLNVARGIAAVPLKLVPEKVPMNMYQEAVKFSNTLSARERDAITKTAISAKYQIMPTQAGMEKLRETIDGYNKKVSESISNSFSKGHPIPVDDLFIGLDSVKDKFKMISDEPLVWDKAFDQIKKQYSEAFKLRPARSLEEVQSIKTRIYKDLESFYEKQKASPAKVELRKTVARNARQSLENLIPEIKQLNKEEGALIELWDAVESKANRITNSDLISIGLPVKMGAGAMIGGMVGDQSTAAIGTALGFTLGIYDTPQVKAKLALVMNRLREKGITVNPSTTAVRLGLYQTGRDKP